MEEALRLIIAKSPGAARMAMDTMRALSVNSPVVQSRYNITVQEALADPQAEFTTEDRELLAEHVSAGETGIRQPMRRMMIQLPPELAEWLAEESERRNTSQAQIVREALERYRENE